MAIGRKMDLSHSYWCLLLAATWFLTACSNGNPVIKSLGLESGEITLYQLQQPVTSLTATPMGELQFEITCAAGMTSLQFATKADGPWTEVNKIDCTAHRAAVEMRLTDLQSQKIFLRTSGGWGKSTIKEVPIIYSLNLLLSGVPSSPSKQMTFSISVSGDSIAGYKFAFGGKASLDCSQLSLYSDEQTLETPIIQTDVNYSSLPDGEYRLCVLVKSTNGLWMSASAAEIRDWVKDTTAQLATVIEIDGQSVTLPYADPFKSRIGTPAFKFEVSGDEGATVEVHTNSSCQSLVGSGVISNKTTTISSWVGAGFADGNTSLWVLTTDALLNTSACQYLFVYQRDSVAPAITNIAGPANGSYAVSNLLEFDVSLSEGVKWDNQFGDPSLTLKINTYARQASFVLGSSTSTKLHFKYQIQAGDDDNDGIVVESPLFLPVGLSLTDDFGNALNTNFVSKSFSSVFIDTAGPQLTALGVPAAGWYKAGSTLNFDLNFSETISIAGGTPNLEIAKCLNAICDSVSTGFLSIPLPVGQNNTNQLTFSYTVANGQEAPYGIKILKLNASGATLKDAFGNTATLTLPAESILQTGLKMDGNSPILSAVTLNSGAVYATSKDLSLSLGGGTDGASGSGISKVLINENSCSYSGTWNEYDSGSTISYTTSATNSSTVTVFVKLKDQAGNITGDADCRSDSIYLDLADPTITGLILNSAASFTNSLTVPVSFSLADVGSGLAYFSLSTGACDAAGAPSGTWETVPAGGSVNRTLTLGAGDGLKTISVWVKDNSARKTCASTSITLDTQSPTLIVTTSPAAGLTNTSQVSVTSLGMVDATFMYYYCWVEATPPSTAPTGCGSWKGPLDAATAQVPDTYTLSSDGIRDLYLVVKDQAGNISTNLQTFTLDRTAPVLSLLKMIDPLSNISSDKTPSFELTGTFSAGDSISFYENNACSDANGGMPALYSGSAAVDGATSIVLTTNLSEGTHDFSAKVTDRAGNTSCKFFSSPSEGYTVDTIKPSITTITSSGGPWAKLGQSLDFSITLSEECDFSHVAAIQLPLVIGNQIPLANCVLPANPSFGSVLNCAYTIQSTDNDIDGIALASNLSYSGSNIVDRAGNQLNLNLPALALSGGLTSLKVDGTLPDGSHMTIDDGDFSTFLNRSLPISWAAATDSGSGIHDYQLQIIDSEDNDNILKTQSFTNNPPPSVVITGLTLTDKIPHHSYRARVLVTDNAGNSVLVDNSDGWKVVVFKEYPANAIDFGDGTVGFGKVMALSPDGQRLMVSLATNPPKVNIYKRNIIDGTWANMVSLDDPSNDVNSQFGEALAVQHLADGSYVYAIGAPGNGSTLDGKVYLQKEVSGGTFSALATLTSPYTSGPLFDSTNDDFFGATVKFMGEYLVVGSPGADVSTPSNNAGVIFVFSQSGTSYSKMRELIDYGSSGLGKFLAISSQLSANGLSAKIYSNDTSSSLAIFSYNSFPTPSFSGASVKNSITMNLGSDIIAIESHGPYLALSGSSKIVYSMDSGESFQAVSSASANTKIAIVADADTILASNIGTYLVSLDPGSAIDKVKIFKFNSSATPSLELKQTLSELDLVSGTSLTGAGIVGLGHDIFIGLPYDGKIRIFH